MSDSNKVNVMMNWGLAVGAIFAMAVQKFSYSYIIFTVLLGWNIMTSFVSGKSDNGITPVKILYLFFNILLFFTTLYLTTVSIKHSDNFDKDNGGDLSFYIKTSNLLILFVFMIISLNDTILTSLEEMLPNCGNTVMLLSVFLFTYLLGVMVVNISIILNKKVTDG